jgi:methylated-DNA-protein-cysteine methyltransferase-like protein
MEKMTIKQQVFEIVKKIPKGKVAYFGLIANKVGTTARVVGWILSGMSKNEWNEIPWHRVVAKNGYISSLKLGEKGLLQKQILLSENYEINDDKVNMEKHLVQF